jgi:ABC-2 type transport system permease protein
MMCSLRVELSFRAGWFMDFFSRVTQFGLTLVLFNRLYVGRTLVAGLSWGQMLVLLGTYQCIRALTDTLLGEVNSLCLKVEEGTLDYALLKPISPRLVVSVGRIRFVRLLEVAIGMLLVSYGLDHQRAFVNWTAYLVLLAMGAWLKYCIGFCLNSTTFWFMEVYGFYGLFDQVFDLARYPSSVFRGIAGILLSYIVPVSIMANLPTLALIQGPTVTQFLALGLQGVLWFLVGQFLWAKGVAGYSSASS